MLKAAVAVFFVLMIGQIMAGCLAVLGDYQLEDHPAAEPFCAKGDHRCNDEFLLACNQTSDGWTLAKTCGTRDQCDDKGGTCSVCMHAGELRCRGAVREACDDTLSKWEAAGAPCSSAELCNPSGCGECPVPGAVRCDGAELKQCGKLPTGQNGWVTVDTCATEALCTESLDTVDMSSASGKASCVKPGCDVPGQLHCTGAQLERCRSSRDGWMALDLCMTPALCDLTAKAGNASPDLAAQVDMCQLGCGTAGAFQCAAHDDKPGSTKSILQKCKDDLTGWETIRECTAPLQCDSNLGTCAPCTPGAYRCNVASLELCDKDATWQMQAQCDSSALCSTQQDAVTGKWSGACKPKVCPATGTFRCNPDNPSILEECNIDLTGWERRDSCASAGLCNAKSKKCDTPVCTKDANGDLPFLCDGAAKNVVKKCKADFTGWEDTGITCKAGEYCVTTDHKDPCKMSCPATNQCDGKELQKCTANGWVHQADCTSADLCSCALNKSCSGGVGTSGCGVVVCGGTKAGYQCAGSQLQKCAPGRDKWVNSADCGSSALCYPGVAPTFEAGYCAVCVGAGEVQCAGSATRTCAADRRSWTAQMNCAHGCIDSGASDYCAACSKGELRCSGAVLQKCSDDQRTLTTKDTCALGCVANGTNDGCAVCVKDETRCLAGTNKLQKCADDRMSLVDAQTCASSCIDNGTADYCGVCKQGDKQCSGTGVQTCGADGKWMAATQCPHGCVGNGVCAPECNPANKETRCSTATALQACGTDGKWSTTSTACANGCFGSTAGGFYCGDCKPGQTQCASGGLLVCGADGKWPDKAMACPAGCLSPTGAPAYCGVCNAGDTQCAGGALQTCGNDRRWGAAMTCAIACVANGKSAYCADCASGGTKCTGGQLQTCVDATQKWGNATTCMGGFGCAGDSCAVCSAGETRCSGTGAGSTLLTCAADRKSLGSPQTCAFSCVDAGSADHCGACTPIKTCPTGRVCGTLADGCGAFIGCGDCTGSCNAAGTVCTCVKKTPAQACTGGQNCGTAPDGCGTTLSCGTCMAPQTCGANNICSCTPLTVAQACAGQDCGTASDGCGNTVMCANKCTAPDTCTNNKCSCAPLTAAQACAGQDCGTASDGCGKMVSCPTCTPPDTCGANNKCSCKALTVAQACAGQDCGMASDGCGKMVSCPTCTPPDTCGANNKCSCKALTIAQACAGQPCGMASDGCGKMLQCPSTCTPPNSCGADNTCSVCTPLTATQACPVGQTCGSASDGCGKTVSCGTCKAPNSCGADKTCSVCTPLTATQACAVGQTCGSASDGCGKTVSCGTCKRPNSCGADKTCSVCTPLTAAEACTGGQDCDTASDGCIGTVSCGMCTAPATCGGDGVPKHCGVPIPADF